MITSFSRQSAFTMMEVLGATGIVMLLTAVVGTSIMGVVDSSKDATIERQLQTINSAYQSYLAAGGPSMQIPGDRDSLLQHLGGVRPITPTFH